MKKIKCLIIDDNDVELKILEIHLRRLPHIEIIAKLSNPIDALPYFHQETIDLLFLDINLPEINGVDFLKMLENPVRTIFVTSYPDYALKAFDLGVFDYLVKPYTFERLVKAVNRAMDFGNKTNQMNEENHVFLKSGRDLLKFYLQKIDYFEAYGSFTKIYHDNKVVTLSESISNIQEKMADQNFIRVHKSYLVAKQKITGISSKNILMEKTKIPLGISYREVVEKSLGS